MTWFANPERQRAFKVDRVIKSRNTIVLVNWCGATWEETRGRLAENGYQEVNRRPRYAEPGDYGLDMRKLEV